MIGFDISKISQDISFIFKKKTIIDRWCNG